MGLSNQHGHLVLACGNKSELSVGYSTIYGDAVGGFAPIKDLPKTWVGGWRAGATRPPRRVARRRPSRRRRSARSRRRSCGRDSSTPTRCPPTASSTTSWTTTSSRTAGRRAAGGRLRPGAGREGAPDDRPRRSTSVGSTPPGPKISFKAFGRGPAAAINQPLAGARAPAPDRRPAGGKARNWYVPRQTVPTPLPESTAPYGSGPAAATPRKRVRVPHLRAMKERGEHFAMLNVIRPAHRGDLRPGRHPGAAVGDSGRQQTCSATRRRCR
jgi:hypothetical protein